MLSLFLPNVLYIFIIQQNMCIHKYAHCLPPSNRATGATYNTRDTVPTPPTNDKPSNLAQPPTRSSARTDPGHQSNTRFPSSVARTIGPKHTPARGARGRALRFVHISWRRTTRLGSNAMLVCSVYGFCVLRSVHKADDQTSINSTESIDVPRDDCHRALAKHFSRRVYARLSA